MFAANSIIAFIFCVILVDSQILKEFDECDAGLLNQCEPPFKCFRKSLRSSRCVLSCPVQWMCNMGEQMQPDSTTRVANFETEDSTTRTRNIPTEQPTTRLHNAVTVNPLFAHKRPPNDENSEFTEFIPINSITITDESMQPDSTTRVVNFEMEDSTTRTHNIHTQATTRFHNTVTVNPLFDHKRPPNDDIRQNSDFVELKPINSISNTNEQSINIFINMPQP